MNPLYRALGAAFLGLTVLCSVGCSKSDSDDGDNSCTPDDQDGVLGGNVTVLVSVSDTAFTVGGVNSGSTQSNISIQNSTNVTLTLTNTGTKPHDLTISCIPTGLPAMCMNETSCFPTAANIGTLMPGDSKTVTFVAPVVEGIYQFVSDVDGDTTTDSSGKVTGLVGQFNLM